MHAMRVTLPLTFHGKNRSNRQLDRVVREGTSPSARIVKTVKAGSNAEITVFLQPPSNLRTLVAHLQRKGIVPRDFKLP